MYTCEATFHEGQDQMLNFVKLPMEIKWCLIITIYMLFFISFEKKYSKTSENKNPNNNYIIYNVQNQYLFCCLKT